MEKQRVLSSQLLVKNRVFEVALDGDLLSWRELVRRTRISGGVRDALRAGSRSVAVSEIIAVRETEPDSCLKEDGRWQKMAQTHPCAFTVSYVERGSQHCWRCVDVTFQCPDGALCQRWVQAIKEQLSLLTSRPKRLLVYINPYGGKRQGKRIYEQKVAPLFARASISTEVIGGFASLAHISISMSDGILWMQIDPGRQMTEPGQHGQEYVFIYCTICHRNAIIERVMLGKHSIDQPHKPLSAGVLCKCVEPLPCHTAMSRLRLPRAGPGTVSQDRCTCMTVPVSIVTERANHARDHLNTEADLRRYSGVVCVGGDGMFSEVIHGLLARTQRDAGVDQNCAEESLVPCTLRVGIIPAGSTDCICYATVGINDPITSALHIIVGDSQPMDVCSIHHNNTFLRYSVSLLGYGFYGDVLADSESKQWMGPARYDISGVKTFLTHNYYEGTVSFLPAQSSLGSPRDKTRCSAGCYVCLHSGQLHSQDRRACEGDEDVSGREDDGAGGWQVLRGKFLAINSASMSCACPRSPKGLSPAAHLADGTADLILVRKCSRLNFLRHLLRHTSKDDQFDLDFVEVHRVRRFRFTPRHCESELDLKEHGKTLFGHICRDHPACGCTALNSSWNCDGEILQQAAIDVGVHCQLIRLFARGIEEPVITEDMRGLNAV